MFIIADVLLFLTTSLVLSITALCTLTYIRARDHYSLEFLTILVPLSLQMLLTQFVTYVHRLFPEMVMTNTNYRLFAWWVTGASIVFTTLLLYTAARYLIRLLPTAPKQTSIALLIMRIVIIIFFVGSIVIITIFSDLEIIKAMNITFSYHFFAGSYVMVILGVSALYYKRFVKGWEQESLLAGIIATFCPLLFTFPLDLVFFRDQTFKIAYLSYSVFVVYLYFFIARRYFQEYEHPVEEKIISEDYLSSKGI
ncbi:MAG: LuxR family transcriptional regulator, partial [Spirochaetia bacterium]|nr:LuxR family transcriptional regulator [Spirochaetia bacterium]